MNTTCVDFYDDDDDDHDHDDDDSEIVNSTMYEVLDNNVVIFRGDKDRFTRKISCNESKAVCFDESCVYCQCMEGQTFVRTRGSYGECVSNELLVYATTEAYFLVQNYPNERCLNYKDNNRVDFVRKGTCYDNSKYYWIWTNNRQLLNRKSLKCMTDNHVTADKIHFIVMKKCDLSNTKQLWKCERIHGGNYIKTTQSDRFLRFGGKYQTFATAGHIHWQESQTWARYGSKQDVCSQAVGCETFADGSSIITLNKTKCEENSECLGEKKIDLAKTGCTLLPHQSQYLHNDTWTPLEMKNGSFKIEANIHVSLKWNLKKTPNSWAGLMVKVRFKCKETTGPNVTETEHCVVIKYTGTFEGFYYEDDSDDDEDGDDNDGKDEDGNNDTGDKNENDKHERSNDGDEGNTKTIIIIVCVLLALLLAGVVAFIVYKYRNRFFRSRKENAERQDEADQGNYATTMNPLYPVNDNLSGQRECELYEPASDHVYQCVDAVDPPSQNHTYDYAAVDGPLMAEGKGEPTTKQLSPKYHNLKGRS